MDSKKFKRLAKKSIVNDRILRRRWVKQAKEEARRNLAGEDLKKCIKALEAWEHNTQTE